MAKDTCHICDGTSFSWGKVGERFWSTFVLDGASRWRPKRYRVRARRCESCGNIQLFNERPKRPVDEKEKRKRGE
jgi:TolB-like protein